MPEENADRRGAAVLAGLVRRGVDLDYAEAIVPRLLTEHPHDTAQHIVGAALPGVPKKFRGDPGPTDSPTSGSEPSGSTFYDELRRKLGAERAARAERSGPSAIDRLGGIR